MFPSFKIARLFRIDVFLHWTFWLLPLWVILSRGDDGVLSLGMNLVLIAALFGCIVLHELGHALTARHFGIQTRNITLSPLGGIAQLERMSHDPWEEFCIAIAGPLVNVAIAGFLGAAMLVGSKLQPELLESTPGTFVSMLLLMNIVMVVFNMIPAFPMDGGRVLRAILANWLGLLQGTRVAVTVGTVFAILIGLAGLFLNPWLLFIAVFVIFAGRQELAGLEGEEQRRHEEEDEMFTVAELAPSRAPVRTTVYVWDSGQGRWVRRALEG